MSSRGRVLVIDDDRPMCDLLRDALGTAGFDVHTETEPHEALEYLRTHEVDALLTDLQMRGMGGLEVTERALGMRSGLPVIMITAFGSLDAAVAAIRAGAYDFLTKPFDMELAVIALDRAVAHERLRADVRRLRAAAQPLEDEDLIGNSRPMLRVRELIARIRDSDIGVLVTGESGTGKELVARALHRNSPRQAGPFVAVNCAALPEALLESELFGHARGAYTDARSARQGLFMKASGGTLFLDEVGEMPLGMQVKLLRALQERSVRPVGSDQEQPFDVRIVAATNRDLPQAVEDGRFRDDLYFRLNVLEIDLPPLRARGQDVLLLAQRFLESAARTGQRPVRGIAPETARKLLQYHWPGNVRELLNCIERAVALSPYDLLMVEDLPERVRDYRPSHVIVAADDPGELVALEEVERRYILRVLDSVGGSRTEAARILQVDRKTLYRKLDRWGSSSSQG